MTGPADLPALARRHHLQVTGRQEPQARTLVFLHGFGCDQTMWRAVAPAFEHDHRVVRLDQIGAGRSDLSAYDSRRHASLHGYAEDLVEVCRALGPRPVVLVGHSVSAMTSVLAAIAAPQCVERLVLVAPSPCYVNDPPHYHGGFERADLEGLLELMERNDLAWARLLAPTVMQNPERPELTAELQRSFCAMEPAIARQFARVTFLADHRADLPALRTPSLILQCQGDPLAPAEVGEYLHAHLRGSRLHRLAATGHCPHVSHPEETIRALSQELARRSER